MIKNKGCCSLELAEEIKKLGIVQKSIWSWNNRCVDTVNFEWQLSISKSDIYERVSAWTVAELGDFLPLNYKSEKCLFLKKEYICGIEFIDGEDIEYYEGLTYGETEADSRAEQLIYLIKNGLVKVEDLNKKLEEK